MLLLLRRQVFLYPVHHAQASGRNIILPPSPSRPPNPPHSYASPRLPIPSPNHPTHRRHPLSVKADCFHASRVLRASALSHYIRQRGDGERGSMIGSGCVAVFQKLWPELQLRLRNFISPLIPSSPWQGCPCRTTTQCLTWGIQMQKDFLKKNKKKEKEALRLKWKDSLEEMKPFFQSEIYKGLFSLD